MEEMVVTGRKGEDGNKCRSEDGGDAEWCSTPIMGLNRLEQKRKRWFN